nr:hypothetical protein [Tanacetum cinerariifolium]
MVKFPTPRGVETLVTQSAIISECRRLERKQMIEHDVSQNANQEKEAPERVDLTEKILVNPAYPDQLEPADMTGIPRRIIEHSLNVSPSVELVAQKQGLWHPTEPRLQARRWMSRRNLEAYVDGMVIKSNNEKVLIEDITETFDNLRRINMKLNPIKCSFRVEEGKFLGYMVTFEGIRANMQSPRTLKDMQSLSGKLVALKRFLSRGAEKSLPFFETLKDITKENKDEYRKRGNALRIPGSGNGGQELCSIRKTGFVVVAHVQEATKASGKLAKYSVELGAYNIAYDPRSAMKGQVLADFLSEAPTGTPTEEFFRLPAKFPNKDDMESASGVEFSYALRLNFTSTNNEAEYEALLAGLRMARKKKVRNIDVKVDSKLVASQINRSYMASSTSMIKYLATTKECIAKFETFVIQNIPRNLNQKDDILSKLATHAFDHLMKKVLVEVLAERLTDQKEVREIVEEEEDNWMTPIIRCLADGVISGPHVKSVGPLQANYVIGRSIRDDAECTSAQGPWEDENEDELRLNMDLLQEIREAVTIREAKYKIKMEQYHNQKVRPTSFKPDEYIFRRNEAIRVDDQRKLGWKWEGPYRVTESYQNGSYKLQTMRGKEVPRTCHTINLRKCYV